MKNTLKTKVLCIFTVIFLLMSTMPLTAMAADEHIHGDGCDHSELLPDESTASTQSESDIDDLYCLIFGHNMVKFSEQTIEAGGSGYDYCSSTIVVETWNCSTCLLVAETRIGETTQIPHQWSVGWCGQTCTVCNIVEMFHEEGGCWYCS